MEEMKLEKLILHFAQSNKAEGKSAKTAAWYTEILTSFTRFISDTGDKMLYEFSINLDRDVIIH